MDQTVIDNITFNNYDAENVSINQAEYQQRYAVYHAEHGRVLAFKTTGGSKGTISCYPDKVILAGNVSVQLPPLHHFKTIELYDGANVTVMNNKYEAVIFAYDKSNVYLATHRDIAQSLTINLYDETKIEVFRTEVSLVGLITLNLYDKSFASVDSSISMNLHDNSSLEIKHVTTENNSIIKAYNNAHLVIGNDISYAVYDNATLYATGRSIGRAHDNSTVYLYDRAVCHAYDHSTVDAYGDYVITKKVDQTATINYIEL